MTITWRGARHSGEGVWSTKSRNAKVTKSERASPGQMSLAIFLVKSAPNMNGRVFTCQLEHHLSACAVLCVPPRWSEYIWEVVSFTRSAENSP